MNPLPAPHPTGHNGDASPTNRRRRSGAAACHGGWARNGMLSGHGKPLLEARSFPCQDTLNAGHLAATRAIYLCNQNGHKGLCGTLTIGQSFNASGRPGIYGLSRNQGAFASFFTTEPPQRGIPLLIILTSPYTPSVSAASFRSGPLLHGP